MLKYSKESFGYLIVFPDGSIDLFSDDAKGLLDLSTNQEDFEPYKLSKIQIGPNFHLSSPLIVWYELTRKCNLACTHCYIDAGLARKDELTFSEVCASLDDLHDLGAFSIVFAGGEPYLRKDFSEILSYAANLGFVIAIVSNGHYLTEAVLEQFPTTNCRLTLSVDGIEAHSRTRKNGSTFELMKSKIELLKRMNIPHSISTVISKANIHELELMLQWCIEEDIIFRTVTFNPLGRGLLHLDEHELTKQDAEASSRVFMMQKRFESEKDKTTGMCVSKFFNYALNLMFMTRREHCSRSIAYIAANGDVYPCVSAAATETFGAGNIRTTPFSELWRDSFEEMRSITWKPFVEHTCHECPLNTEDYFCANRCPVMSLVVNGTLFGCGANEFEKEDLRLRTELLRLEMNCAK